jgi:hypothetical protein
MDALKRAESKLRYSDVQIVAAVAGEIGDTVVGVIACRHMQCPANAALDSTAPFNA